QNLQIAAYLRCCLFRRDALLESHRSAIPALASRGTDLIYHLCRSRTFLRRISKYSETFEALRFNKLKERFEVGFALSRKAHDERRSQRQLGDFGAQRRNKVLDVFA